MTVSFAFCCLPNDEVSLGALKRGGTFSCIVEKAVVDLEDLWGGRKWAPTPELSKSVLDALVSMHGSRSRGKERVPESTVVDSLVRTILSQNTTDVNSLKCFELLKARFSTWEELLETNDKEVADTIKLGGLSQIKTQRIKTIFRQVIADHGSISLEHLRSESTENVKKVLSQFKGVGPKTIACVLMFNLQRDEFPVDTVSGGRHAYTTKATTTNPRVSSNEHEPCFHPCPCV